jgi:Uma2 family endonuclease
MSASNPKSELGVPDPSSRPFGVPVRPPGQYDLPYEDGEPLESNEHVIQNGLLKEPVRMEFEKRPAFVATNLGIYFSDLQVRNNDFRAPDIMVVLGVEPDQEILSWVVWERGGQTPDVVVEVLSPSTRDVDLGEKKRIYERVLKVHEYYVWDLAERRAQGWQLQEGAYVPIAPDEQGHLACHMLGLKLGIWSGAREGRHRPWLRWLYADGTLVPTAEERAAQQTARAEQETARAEQETARAAQEAARAEQEAARAAELGAKVAAYEARFGALDPS